MRGFGSPAGRGGGATTGVNLTSHLYSANTHPVSGGTCFSGLRGHHCFFFHRVTRRVNFCSVFLLRQRRADLFSFFFALHLCGLQQLHLTLTCRLPRGRLQAISCLISYTVCTFFLNVMCVLLDGFTELGVHVINEVWLSAFMNTVYSLSVVFVLIVQLFFFFTLTDPV